MQIFSHPVPLILAILLMLLHFVAPALPALFEKIMKYANICLHIVLYFALILFKIPLDEVVLVYLVSLLLYILSALLWQRIDARSEQSAAKEEGESKK